MRVRLRWAAAAGALLTLAAASVIGAGVAEHAVERRIADIVRAQAGALGVSVETVSFRWMAPLTLGRVVLRPPSGERLTIDDARISWSFTGGREPRAHVRRLSLFGLRFERGPLVAEWPSAELDVVGWDHEKGHERIRVRQSKPSGELDVELRRAGQARETSVAARAFDLSGARITWQGEPLTVPGVWTGRFTVSQLPGRL